MKKIIGVFHPFDLYQTFYVYEDSEKLEAVQTKIENIPETVFKLSEMYNVDKIDIAGTKMFTRGIMKRIQDEEMLKYSKNKIEIKLV
jgi:hypothetical protein